MAVRINVWGDTAREGLTTIASSGTGIMGGSLEVGKTIANDKNTTVGTITSVTSLGSSAVGTLGLTKTSSAGALASTTIKISAEFNKNYSQGDTVLGSSAEAVGSLSIGDVLGTAAAIAALFPAGAPIALGLTVAGLGYTVWSLTANAGQDVTIKDLIKMHPDNYRQDSWGNPEHYRDYKEGVNRNKTYHVTDPLVLDLDGDGIETVSHDGYKGALFDHDGDGIRTASGWVGKDDGLLVIDRNGDGVINDGRELFGDSYILKDGSKAAHGYAALAEYDENGDGKIDAQDADFAKLRVWRDLNQDGISQQDELFTLEEAGVQSLNAAYQDTNQNLGNGNRLAQEGSYPDKEGKERKMGDLLFGNNTLYSRYSASVKLTDEQRAAANLQGTGRLRDLREAAALSPLLQSYYRIGFKQKQKCLWKEIQGQFKRSSETVFQTTF